MPCEPGPRWTAPAHFRRSRAFASLNAAVPRLTAAPSPVFLSLQMDDEASLLPRKLQAALEQALEQRNDIINQDSDSESDEGERATDRRRCFSPVN